MTTILSKFNGLIFFTGTFLEKFAVKRLLKISPFLAYVAALPFETLISENKR